MTEEFLITADTSKEYLPDDTDTLKQMVLTLLGQIELLYGIEKRLHATVRLSEILLTKCFTHLERDSPAGFTSRKISCALSILPPTNHWKYGYYPSALH